LLVDNHIKTVDNFRVCPKRLIAIEHNDSSAVARSFDIAKPMNDGDAVLATFTEISTK